MKKTIDELINSVDTAALQSRPLSDWRPILAEECQVYVFGENYLAKRFDQINYKFCEKLEAKEILIDNLYALLRFKYFPKTSEEIDERINKIIASFTANLKTTLLKVSFDKNSDSIYVKTLPDYCVAFRNGVFNFKDNDWLFKYDIIELKKLKNKIYVYDSQYVIMWYLDYNFESFGIDIMSTPLNEFIEIMKDLTSSPDNRNYCFELLYNISHDINNVYSFERFSHLCEILGYTILQSFSQHFVMLIGSGQNGKNSLFDGCFTNRLIPRAASNDLDAIENDRFITGSLENKSHNIFLETSAKTYTESKMIKALTGSMYQTIESKGVSKYSSVINCKYVFAGNDQDNIKFTDTTTGFRRRINMFEIWYRWDSQKKFLLKGDYFDASFSDSLSELKDDITNTSAYIYFAMYGIMSATKRFTSNFKFTRNEWNQKYSDIDVDLKEKIERLTLTQVLRYMESNDSKRNECKTLFYSLDKERLYNSKTMSQLGYTKYDDLINMLKDEEAHRAFFADNDVYISLKILQSILGEFGSQIVFTNAIKKIYSLKDKEIVRLDSNKSYVKCTFYNGKLRIISDKS